MQASDIAEQLKQFIANTVLDGKDIGLDETTPLLEWGIINSLEIARLLDFIQKQFGVHVPAEKMVADHFTNIRRITNLIMQSQEI